MPQCFAVYNLRDTYHELGQYSVKIVLNPKMFKNSQLSEIKMFDSDRKEMRFNVKKWGRKINCDFIIDRNVSDGVSVVEMDLKDSEGNNMTSRLTFWVIKP